MKCSLYARLLRARTALCPIWVATMRRIRDAILRKPAKCGLLYGWFGIHIRDVSLGNLNAHIGFFSGSANLHGHLLQSMSAIFIPDSEAAEGDSVIPLLPF